VAIWINGQARFCHSETGIRTARSTSRHRARQTTPAGEEDEEEFCDRGDYRSELDSTMTKPTTVKRDRRHGGPGK
jgi:hypothetical protein